MPEDKCKLNLNSLTEKVNKKVQELKQTQIPPVIVLAPIFNANNITDGYYQRISIIDSSILKDFYKIYIHLQEDYTADPVMDDFYIYEIDDLHMEIGLNPRISETQLLLDSIFKLCKVIYIHTALRLIKRSTGNGIRLLIHKYKLDVFWDVHGAVPNEFALHKDYWGAQEASESEYWLANYSNTIIVVTFAMKKYLIHKYGFRISRKIVVLPIFNEEICDISILKKEKLESKIPTVIYAGGLQKWQNIREMQYAISNAKNYNYFICVPKPHEFWQMWLEQGLPTVDKMKVEEKSPKDLYELYYKCNYGFALRDENIVNRVACPTKIIEYIEFGILPILKSPEIGDFCKMGMKYVPLEDFKNQNLPNSITQMNMVKHNFNVLKKMRLIHRKSYSKLIKRLHIRGSYSPRLVFRQSVGIILLDINDENMLKDTLYLYNRLRKIRKIYILVNTFEWDYLLQYIPLECIYSYSGKIIKNHIYGKTKEDFQDFCKTVHMDYIYYDKKYNIRNPKNFDYICSVLY